MKNLKTSRTAGFSVIFAVYAITGAAGIILDRILPFAFWLNLLLADTAATVLVFAGSLICKNASVYDPYWSVQPMVILICAGVIHGMDPVRWLLLISVCVWGVRLTANWAYTFKNLSHQDWRYTMLCEKTGKLYPVVNFCGIHLFPTLVVYLCVLPAVFVFYTENTFNALNAVCFLLSVGAAVWQGVADWQMHSFRKTVHKGFIRTGLWKHTRHPNYLGEILMWWGVGLNCVAVMPERFYLLAGALVNTLMFLLVSIPMADKRQAGKEGFEAYKKATRMLLPIKKRG